MALSLHSQWTLVASGLVAHADRVLSGEECERLMALVDEEVDGDAYAEWMGIVGDLDELEARFQSLPLPPAEDHRQILEDAWLMAVVDGERHAAELEVLGRIAARLRVEAEQLEFWREAWSAAQLAHAETAAAVVGYVLGGGEPLHADDAGVFEGFVLALPTTHEHRAQLVAAGPVLLAHDDAKRKLRALGRPPRRDLLRRLAGAAAGAVRADEARARWRALGRELGHEDDELDRFADA
jgi:DnaJ-domain-containing protein 1